MNKINKSENDTDQVSNSAGTKRRSILKGAAGAVPMILTLRSGSALAATSIGCDTKLIDANFAVPAISDTDDGAYRVPRDVYTIRRKESGVKVFKTIFQIDPDAADPNLYISVTDRTDNALAVTYSSFVNSKGKLKMKSSDDLNWNIDSGPEEKYVAVIMGENGVVALGADNTTNDGTANITDSCWDSLNPNVTVP